MNLLTASLVFCAMMALTQAFICPPGWIKYDIRCLLYVPETRTWSDAESHCRFMNGGLVAALKNQFSENIDDIMKHIGPEIPQLLVGGCNTDSSSWDWSTFDWYGAPRNPSCIKRTHEGSWECIDAVQCKDELPSICSITLM
ncbi:type-2 ice-structuring protein [Labrus bergylta]|uniref:type-2 ice-structuring protein n=1 Tax=Labrus bergylta TaxID=56723 RepID=UPI0033132D2C